MNIPTYQESPSFWNEIAKNHQSAFIVLKSLRNDGCFYCKTKKDNFEEMAFHIESTHGLPREALIELLKEVK